MAFSPIKAKGVQMLNTTSRKIGLLAAMIAALTGANALPNMPPIKARGQRGMRDIIGPATNWPSGKIHRKPRGDTGQHPKFAKQRKRTRAQPIYPRDEYGAVTLTGAKMHYIDPYREPSLPVVEIHAGFCRRIWLAGISAQRGY